MSSSGTRAFDTPSEDVTGKKRPALDSAELARCTGSWDSCQRAEAGPSGSGDAKDAHLVLHPQAELDALQRRLVTQFLRTVDPNESSIVITNPRAQGNPIVWVTRPWQDMCGFTYGEAVGRNPRLTQGERSDPAVVAAISGALQQERPCKAAMVNYRGGEGGPAFWNMLSISPLLHRGQLQLYIANLQDYSYHMGQMVSLTPSQFCRAALHYRRGRRLDAPLTSLSLAKPAIYEADGEHPLQPAPEPPPAQPMMRRLGWNKLVLEPEHLADRVGDALSRIDAQYELAERLASGESVVVSARSGDVVMRVLVSEEADGHYSISCARLSGDTFSYHAAFRQLKAALGEALTQHPLQSRGFVTPPTGAARGALPLARALPALTAP
mmetsp:Transcript_24839/g.73745  ORF Transcript_24839/g.73745 Transcript_24839/m.73745 type:complete len:382 (-) Transcript_24839:141-1286(-)